MKKYNMSFLIGIILGMFGATFIHSMTVVKPRPILKPETREKIFKGKLEGHMQTEGLCKKGACKPGEFFVHQDSEWGVCISQEAANLSGLLKSMVDGLRGAAELGYEQSNDIPLDIPLEFIGGVSPTIVIKYTCDFLKQYNENKTKSAHPNNVSFITESVLSLYKGQVAGQPSYLYRLANIANGLKYLDCSFDMLDGVEKAIQYGMDQDPESEDVKECFKTLSYDLRQKLFMDSVWDYLKLRIMKPKKVALQCEGKIAKVVCSADGNTIVTVHREGKPKTHKIQVRKGLKMRFEGDKKEILPWKIILWDMKDKDNVKQILLQSVDAGVDTYGWILACSPDGKKVVFGKKEFKNLKLFDVRDKSNIKSSILVPTDLGISFRCEGVGFMQDSNNMIAIYATSDDRHGSIIKWNINDQSKVQFPEERLKAFPTNISGDGQKILFASKSAKKEKKDFLLNISNPNNIIKNYFETDERPWRLNFDGTKGISWEGRGYLRLYKLTDEGAIDIIVAVPLLGNKEVLSAALTPNGRIAICLIQDDNTGKKFIQLMDAEQKEWVKEFVFDCNDKRLTCDSDECFISWGNKTDSAGSEKKATVWYFLPEQGKEVLEGLLSHGDDQDLLL